jgi:tyrosinase
MTRLRDQSLTRRVFLEGSTAALATSLVSLPAMGQGAKFRRYEISDPNMPPSVVDSYKKAISKMLNRDQGDPRNWYRNAFVHVFDCPHGNWWFLVWHRAYLGWFERICRELSEDPDFALPYWDWTKTPKVPTVVFDGVLDPNNTEFIGSVATFKQHFEPTVAALWPAFSQGQKNVLVQRGMSGPADFWSRVQHPLRPMFFNQPNARGLTPGNPNLDQETQVAVSIGTITDALRVSTFAETPSPGRPIGFGSDKAQTHNGGSRQGILESQPHNNVHGALGGDTGGFMVNFLSPVDPIFFLHHANIDRLWDVWTRRQAVLGRPTLPQGADLARWSGEQLLFFCDEQGQPVSRIQAGDYKDMSVFDYDYSPGTGEDEVPTVTAAAPQPPPPMQTFSARITSQSATARKPAEGVVEISAGLLKRASPQLPPAVAEVTLDLKHDDEGRRFKVLVTPEGGAQPVLAGAITVFGHPMGPTTFSVPLPEKLVGAEAVSASLNISVVPLESPRLMPMSPGAESVGRPLVTAIDVSVPK